MDKTDVGLLYQAIVENTSEGVWVIDANNITSFVNAAMASMLGYSREELIGKSMFDVMDDEGRRIATANVERRKQGIAEPHEFLFRKKDGTTLWTRLATGPLPSSDGSYRGAFALVTDITDERRRDGERARLWQILDESLNEIYIFGRDDLRFVYVNRGALRNLGFTLEQMRTMTPLDIKPEQTLESFAALVAPLRAGQRPKIEFQTVHRRRDGTDYIVDVHLQLVPGDPPVFVAIINDITDRVEAERVARAGEARFRALIEANLDLLLLVDGGGAFTFASPSVESALGFTVAEMLGQQALGFVHPDDVDAARTALEQAATGTPAEIELRARHKDGSFRTLAGKLRGHIDNPDLRAITINARDVTNERKLEERLRQAQRLGSIGRLAGGVAHDFNNILTAILGSASFLDEDTSLTDVAREDVREILRAGARAGDLTNQLLAFASRRVVHPRNVDLGALVRGQERFLARVIGEQVTLRTTLAADLWPVLADPSQLEQVVLNLVVNARDAMPDGGKVTVEAHNVVLDEAFASSHGDIAAGPTVVLTVSDTGDGIAPDVLPHIFEPFFTTKAVGAGTGLGLATVWGIVRQCNGHISVYSEVGLGTTFKVYLPRAPTDVIVEEPPAAPSAASGHERVLVVEDEEGVRRMVVRTLEAAGYVVQAEPTPAGALAAAERSVFDLVVTDVVMPGMNGKQLAQQLQRRVPRLPVLFVSGYTEDTIVHRGVLEPGVDFLGKPFSPSELRRRVREILDRATSA